jgi:spore coat polysaccharide biosynthesis predicted glycosyltransferase SpsG
MSFDIAYRVHANEEVGAGHWMRSLAWLEWLKESTQYTLAVSGEVDEEYSQMFQGENIRYFSSSHNFGARFLLVDSYEDLRLVFNAISINGAALLFDDGVQESSSRVDFVVSPFQAEQDCTQRYPNAQIFSGTEYLYFRENVHRLKRTIFPLLEVQEVLVSLGASAQTKLLRSVLALVCAAFPRAKICVQGLIEPTADELANDKLEFLGVFSGSFLERLSQVDLVVCAAGQTLLESIHIGTPAVGLVIAENQQSCADALRRQGIPIAQDIRTLEQILNAPPNRAVSSKLGSGVSSIQSAIQESLS